MKTLNPDKMESEALSILKNLPWINSRIKGLNSEACFKFAEAFNQLGNVRQREETIEKNKKK